MIKKADEKHLADIMKLLKEVGNIHADLRNDLFIKDKTKYSKEELISLMKDDSYDILVYTDDKDKVLGYAFLIAQENKGNNLRPLKTLYIDDLCVSEKYRHQHIGSALFAYIQKYAKDNGFYNITLNVYEGNDEAYAFYLKKEMFKRKTMMEIIV